jgi:cobalt/nickel transport system permease protein
MSHIHIPDGAIALWLCVLGYVLVGIYFIIAFFRLKKTESHRKLAVTGVIAALMLLTMSIPIPFVIPYHLNLCSLAGILLGPFFAGLAIFSVNLMLALVGHGGITIVGLNTVVLLTEATVAFLIFRALGNVRVFTAAFIATFAALLVSTALTVGIVYAGTHNLHYMVHHHGCHKHTCKVEDLVPHHEGLKEHDIAGAPGEHKDEAGETFDIRRFLALILVAGSLGWTLESLVTAFIVNYINRVKPDLLSNI